MNFLKIGLSFLLAAILFQTKTTKPEPQAEKMVHVYIYPMTMDNTKTPMPANLPGHRIAGISCIPKPEKITPDAAVCYIATTLN